MQGDLFSTGALAFNNGPDLPLQREQLLAWQQRLHAHQAPLFRGESASTSQGNLYLILVLSRACHIRVSTLCNPQV